MMDTMYRPYFDPEFESLIERIHPPRVSIDNDACKDCTIVKVDSANKDGILLEMVQVLTDLDLVISKSYICSDGGWFMDVFHVTDQMGNKLTDESLILYIQQVKLPLDLNGRLRSFHSSEMSQPIWNEDDPQERALCASRRGGIKMDAPTYHGRGRERELKPQHVSTENTAIEMTGIDRPGLLSEISAVLAELECHVTAAVAWTHNRRVACIIYMEDETKPRGGPITDPNRLAHIKEQLEMVVEAHHGTGERRSVRLKAPAAGRTHTERRLHQLMSADRDYEICSSCGDGAAVDGGGDAWKYSSSRHRKDCCEAYVWIDSCKEKGYSVVNVRGRDRLKLLFDTVCALTDMQYVVFHAAVSSEGSIAVQEYYIRHKDGCTLDTESERREVTQCLIAATERRVSHGLRLDVCTKNRLGLLSDMTRVFRENGLSISRAEIGTRGERAVGSFYVTDASGHDLNPNTIELVRREIGGTVLMVNKSSGWPSQASSSSRSRSRSSSSSSGVEDRPKFSLGSLLWSQLERLSSNFGPIRS